jgi:hypothetical protein
MWSVTTYRRMTRTTSRTRPCQGRAGKQAGSGLVERLEERGGIAWRATANSRLPAAVPLAFAPRVVPAFAIALMVPAAP